MANEAETVAELSRKATMLPHTMKVRDGDLEVECLLVPNGATYTIQQVKAIVEPYRAAPERRRGIATLTDLESFIAHTKRFADADSAVFVDRSGPAPRLVSVLDYHRAGPTASPRFGMHRGVYTFPLSDEWVAWNMQNARPMGQEEFARFLEDHLCDVVDPTRAGDVAKAFVALLSCGFACAGKLLELSRGLDVHIGQRVKQVIKLASGEASVAFDEQHVDAGGAPLKIPGAFLLALPVFRSGAPYEVPTRLRYRVSGGQVIWSFEMHRVQAILDHAIQEACQDVAEETKLPVFEGTPE